MNICDHASLDHELLQIERLGSTGQHWYRTEEVRRVPYFEEVSQSSDHPLYSAMLSIHTAVHGGFGGVRRICVA